MKKFIIKGYYRLDDANFDCDALCIKLIDDNGTVIMEGDYYHDKIEEKIDGFFECLNYLKLKYEKELIKVNEEECNW